MRQDRSAERVARDHCAAVELGDPAAMADDYSVDAVLVRGQQRYEGREAIAAYFVSVPQRLGDARVVFDEVTAEGETVTFVWHLDGASASGRDICRVVGGEIVHQVVHLDAADF